MDNWEESFNELFSNVIGPSSLRHKMKVKAFIREVVKEEKQKTVKEVLGNLKKLYEDNLRK